MKLTFLGTSHGHPELRRYCTSVYIEHNGYGFVVDVGAPVEYLFKNRGIETEKVKAYFLTHMHSDRLPQERRRGRILSRRDCDRAVLQLDEGGTYAA